jgi:CRP-like cAMP-binding protein
VVGIQLYLGGDLGKVEIFQQVAGSVLALAADDFQELLRNSAEARAGMSQFTLGLMRQMTMLLMVRDRVESDVFDLKQQFLAQMLGVRRPGVSIAASMLQRAGLIRYSRGRIQVVNPVGLEAASCECYGALRRGKNYN